MGDMIVRSSGGLAVNNGPSVLGEQQARIPVGGKIRPGIKVLTATARKHPQAQGIYDAGVRAGKKWDTIERELKDTCKFDKSPLTPKNVQYFSVFRADFTNPVMADKLLELYGQDVDGVRRLLRFPVIFPTDSWQANLPHALKCYTSSQLQYWSDYDQAGNRRCMTRKPVEKNAHNQRATRTFGGRDVIPRPDTNGACNPEGCQQYQGGLCNLTADLLFFVPGITGAGAISVPFKSFYGMDHARQQMMMVAYLRGGRISGTHDGKPIFWITKKLQDVQMLDRQTGKPTKVPHWILTLEADIDMLTVFQSAEQRQAMVGNQGAIAALALSTPEVEEPDEHDEDDHDGAIEGEVVDPERSEVDERAQITALRTEVAELVEKAAITLPVFASWMAQASRNPAWGKQLAGLTEAKKILTEALAGDINRWKAERNLDAPF